MAKRRNFGRDMVMVLARQFSRGAPAYALVASPGLVTYATNPGWGQQREFLICRPAPVEYGAPLAVALVQPAGNGRFVAGTTRNVGLMPMRRETRSEPPKAGGAPYLYDFQAENWEDLYNA